MTQVVLGVFTGHLSGPGTENTFTSDLSSEDLRGRSGDFFVAAKEPG